MCGISLHGRNRIVQSRTILLHVFWLMDQPTRRTFPLSQWLFSAFVPNHSGLTATDLHRLPFYPRQGAKEFIHDITPAPLGCQAYLFFIFKTDA
jgi:hypothetical protein